MHTPYYWTVSEHSALSFDTWQTYQLKKQYNLRWCDECGQLARWDNECCFDCINEDDPNLPEEARDLQYYELILTKPNKFLKEEKRQLSSFLLLLGYWRTLSSKEQTAITDFISGEMILYEPMLRFFHLLVGINIMKSKLGSTIRRDKLINQYKNWFTELNELPARMFRDQISIALNLWKSQGWVEKEQANVPGIYRRLAILPNEA